jgi:hypothetical protein
MAYDYIRERTTAIGTGGLLKRIWYAMTGTTQGPELASLDETGKFKCVSEQISSLAGTGNRMMVADSIGNLSASGIIGTGSDGAVKFTTSEIEVKPTITSSLVAGTWYNVCESPTGQPDDTIMVNLACYISSGNNHSALIAISKTSGFYQGATTLASSSSGLVPTYTFRISAGFLQISFNVTNLPANFNTYTIARFS